MALGGLSTSGLFDLKKPVQYLFSARGVAGLPGRSRVVTKLTNFQTGRTIEISGAEIGYEPTRPYNLRTAASLLLTPGRYSWISEVRPNPAPAVTSCFIQATVANSPEAVETVGIREAFSAMSGPNGRNVDAEGLVTYDLGPGERLTFDVVVTSLNSGEQFRSPVIEVEGSDQGTASTGAVPYVLRTDQVYVARVRVNYEGPSSISCLLRQR